MIGLDLVFRTTLLIASPERRISETCESLTEIQFEKKSKFIFISNVSQNSTHTEKPEYYYVFAERKKSLLLW